MYRLLQLTKVTEKLLQFMSAESRVSSEQKLCKKCEISRHFFHFLLNMRKLKNCKSVFFAKFHKNLFHKKMRNFRETKDAIFFRERDLCEFSRKKKTNFSQFN